MKRDAAAAAPRRGMLGVLGASALFALPALLLQPLARAAKAYAVRHSDSEWQALLTPQQYSVLRRAGTERPYSSPLTKEKRGRVFSCAGCQLALFSSATKFGAWHRLAQFLEAVAGCCRHGFRHQLRHAPRRGAVQPLRRTSGPRLRRWPQADRAALLHERPVPGICTWRSTSDVAVIKRCVKHGATH